MGGILHKILPRTKADIEIRRSRVPLSELQQRVKDAPRVRSLAAALQSRGFGIIGEVKTKSPSGGAMNPANVRDALDVYIETPSIVAVSILTDEPFFGGSLERLWKARQKVDKPILRKDFIIDEYQVWEARAFGADAILLMGGIHAEDPRRIRQLYKIARDLDLEVLLELGVSAMSPEEQKKHAPHDAEIWGINCRGFDGSRANRLRMRVGRVLGHDFSTRHGRHEQYRRLIPKGKIAVAESGIHNPSELGQLIELRYNGALISTGFLKGRRRVEETVGAFAEYLAKQEAPRRRSRVPNLAPIRVQS